jgi:hypothetical protein
MTEHPILGRADPLGHVVLVENHQDDGIGAVGCNPMSESVASAHDNELCLRSAKSVVLSARMRVPTGFGR